MVERASPEAFTLAQRPDLEEPVGSVGPGRLPEFLRHDPVNDSGEYVVEGALNPVRMDRERDLGSYVEPNVWMRHDLEGGIRRSSG